MGALTDDAEKAIDISQILRIKKQMIGTLTNVQRVKDSILTNDLCGLEQFFDSFEGMKVQLEAYKIKYPQQAAQDEINEIIDSGKAAFDALSVEITTEIYNILHGIVV